MLVDKEVQAEQAFSIQRYPEDQAKKDNMLLMHCLSTQQDASVNGQMHAGMGGMVHDEHCECWYWAFHVSRYSL